MGAQKKQGIFAMHFRSY